jgi:predicted Zn-dependent peptidase
MSSRLFHELREKRGLAYEIGSHVNYFADGGAAVIEAGVDNRKISKAIKLVLKELSKLNNNLIPRKEFERAREYYQGHLLFLLEDTISHMLWLGNKMVTADEPMDADEILSKIKKVTSDEILKLSREVFRKENLNIAVVGPAGNKEKRLIDEIAYELQ